MKKIVKILLVIMIIVLIIIITNIIAIYGFRGSKYSKILRGYILFGNERCEGEHYYSYKGYGGALWCCEICNEYASIQHKHVLCESCAEITHRCEIDGKKIK